MMHPDTEIRAVSDEIGVGVFATRPIPRGTITWVRDPLDVVISPVNASVLGPLYAAALDRYAFVDRRGDLVLCWDHARYINHACEPTTLCSGFDFDVALRDIARGEEITYDYGVLNLTEPMPCLCGQPACRGEIRPSDSALLCDDWDSRVAVAFADLGLVSQPLWPLIQDADTISRILAGDARVPSVRAHLR